MSFFPLDFSLSHVKDTLVPTSQSQLVSKHYSKILLLTFLITNMLLLVEVSCHPPSSSVSIPFVFCITVCT